MRIDRLLLVLSLFFLAITPVLAGLSFQMTAIMLLVQTLLYATYMFISGIAILVLIEVVHLSRKEISHPKAA